MSGKQAKREAKRLKEAKRELERQKERRQTLYTMAIIGGIVLLGAVLIVLSLERPEEAPVAEPTEDPAERPIACGAEEPPGAARERSPLQVAPAVQLEEATNYEVVFETSCGTVVVDLYEDRAPVAVAHFIGLTEMGFYEGLEIFRNAPSIFALQTGAGTNQNTWQVGYTFPDELEAAEEEGYTPGSLAMANSGPDTNGSQFFFTYGEAQLPPAYTKFGQVREGLDVLESIGAIPVDGELPAERVYLESVTIRSQPQGETDE